VGAWGAGIFSNDTAADIRRSLRELLEDGLSPEEATERLISSAYGADEDPDDATSFWTGLAAAQMALGVLQPRVRDHAVTLIDSGGDIALFTDAKVAAKRRSVLDKLRLQLLGPQKPPVKVRRPMPIPSPVAAGDVFLLKLENGRRARFRVLRIEQHRMGEIPVVELIDETGRPFLERKVLRAARDQRARYRVVPRRKDIPKPDELQVIGKTELEPSADARLYCVWPNLRESAQRLLDDPDAAPQQAS
jgi:hypothetical protein